MRGRRYQSPTPKEHGKFWTIIVWEDCFQSGNRKRRQRRIRLAPIETDGRKIGFREVLRLRDERLKRLDEEQVDLGSATNLAQFVKDTYIPLELPLLATTTQDRYEGVLDNYLLPIFGNLALRELTPTRLQRYFSGMANWKLSQESRDKIRDILASVLNATRKYKLLNENPLENVSLPKSKTGKRKKKPHITPEQFDELVNAISEPYATMVYAAIYSGLRISELLGLKWNDLGFDTISVDERYCRGDWSEPKSESSNATIGVDVM